MNAIAETPPAAAGACEARRAARPRPDSLRPVRPGMDGGRYQPLSEHDGAPHPCRGARRVDQIGFADDAPPSGVER